MFFNSDQTLLPAESSEPETCTLFAEDGEHVGDILTSTETLSLTKQGRVAGVKLFGLQFDVN